MKIAFNSVIFFADNFLSVSFIPYGPEVGINKPWGQKFDSARKHNCSFKYFFQNDSNVKLVSHKSQFYNLFMKLVTGFWGHVWPNVYHLYISESLSLFKQ